MRAPSQTIPTGNFPISVGIGALTALAAIVGATPFPEKPYGMTLLLSPFLSGFFANLAYGSVETGRRHIVPLGLCSFLLFYFLLLFGLLSGWFSELGLHRRELGVVAKSLHPFIFVPAIAFIFVPAVVTALVGGIFGWLGGLVIRR